MPRQTTKTKESKITKPSGSSGRRKKKKSTYQKQVETFWEKHWEIIVAAIFGLIVGLFIVPKFFK